MHTKTAMKMISGICIALICSTARAQHAVEHYAPDFKIPSTFEMGGTALPMYYLETYPIKNDHEPLETWRLYNLCRLIVAASADTMSKQHQSYEVYPFSHILNLLNSNVLDLDIQQPSEVLFLANVAQAIRNRFGSKLEKLAAEKKAGHWHSIWMNLQARHGLAFRSQLKQNLWHVFFSTVNFDRNEHDVSFAIELEKGGVFRAVDEIPNGAISEGVSSAEGWHYQPSKGAAASVIAPLHQQYFVLNLMKLRAPQQIPRGSVCRFVMRNATDSSVLTASLPFKWEHGK